MKKLAVLMVLIALLSSCFSTGSSTQKVESPRREYISVNTDGMDFNDMFVIENNYKSANLEFNDSSKYFSATLLAYDLGIIDSVSKKNINKIAELFFSNMPRENETKIIVIPKLSKYNVKGDETQPIEKDGYFFISQYVNNEGITKYRIESNIPISSYYGKDYNGYNISLNSNFYKDNVPARWVAIMSISFEKDIVIYQGVSYPSKISPLVYSGTGIAPDKWLAKMVTPGLSISTVINELETTVDKATEELPSDEVQMSSVLFLKKYTNVSLSLYSIIAGNKEKAVEYFKNSTSIDVVIPEDIRGAQFKRLNSLVNYLIEN
jgi:hypothetical protein